MLRENSYKILSETDGNGRKEANNTRKNMYIYIFESSNQVKLIIKSSLFRLTRRKRKKNESKIISSNQNDIKITEHR